MTLTMTRVEPLTWTIRMVRVWLCAACLLVTLAGCSAEKMQLIADTMNSMETEVCEQVPLALVAASVAQGTAMKIQQERPGTDADKAVAAANLTVATLIKVQAWCIEKGK